MIEGAGRSIFYVEVGGSKTASADKLKQTVCDEIRDVIKRGISKSSIATACRSLTHFYENTRHDPLRGQSYSESLLTAACGEKSDPTSKLQHTNDLNTLVGAYRAGLRPLEDFLKRGMLENSHCAHITFIPDPNLLTRLETAERQAIALKRIQLGEREFVKLIVNDEHDKPDLLNEELSRIASVVTRTPLTQLQQVNQSFTGGSWISKQLYFAQPQRGAQRFALDLAFDLSTLPSRLIPHAALIRLLLPNLGTNKRSPREMSNRVSQLGMLLESTFCISRKWQSSNSARYLVLDVDGPANHFERTANEVKDLLCSPRLGDRDLVRQTIHDSMLAFREAAQSAHEALPLQRAVSAFSSDEVLLDRLVGVSNLGQLEQWHSVFASGTKSQQDRIIEDLAITWNLLFTSSGSRIHVMCGSKQTNDAVKIANGILASLPAPAAKTKLNIAERGRFSELGDISSPVSALGLACAIPKFSPNQLGAMQVVQNLVVNSILWREVQDRGGSYGISANYDSYSGVFTMGTSQDNAIVRSFRVMLDIGRRLDACKIDGAVLKMLKSGALQVLDSPISKLECARRSFMSELYGRSPDFYEVIRTQVINATAAEVKELGQTIGESVKHGALVSLARHDKNRALLKELEKIDWPVRRLS